MSDSTKAAHLRKQIERSESHTASLKTRLTAAERKNVKASDQLISAPPKFTAEPADPNDPDRGF